MIYAFITMLISVLIIGFLRGSFIAFGVTVLSVIVAYYVGIYFSTGFVIFLLGGLVLYKYKPS